MDDHFKLFNQVAKEYGQKVEIKKDEEFKCDRSLDSSKFMKAMSYMPPSWDEMLDKLVEQIINQK